jgi:hypothetical protein
MRRLACGIGVDKARLDVTEDLFRHLQGQKGRQDLSLFLCIGTTGHPLHGACLHLDRALAAEVGFQG